MAKQKYRYVTGMGGIPIAVPVKPAPKPAKKAPAPPPGFDFRRSAGALNRAQQAANQRADQAKRSLPRQPLPAVPVIQHPTKTQRAAARNLIGQAEKRAAGNGPGAQRVQNLQAFDRLIHTDPRYAAFAEAVDHYAKIETNNRAIRTAQAAGATGSRKDRIAAGNALQLAQTQRDYVKPGQPKSLADKTVGAGLAAILGATTLGNAPADQIVGNAIGDVVNFPLGAVQGIYYTGKAGVDAAHGDTSGLEALLNSYRHSALGELVTGHPVAAGEAFVQHPIYSALDFTAAGGLLGRAAGAAARTGALGERAAAWADTTRAPLELGKGTGQFVSRSYSRNPFLKTAQKAIEADKERRGLDPNVAGATRAKLLRNQAVDQFTATSEGLRRRGRGETEQTAKKLPEPKHASGVVFAAAESRLRGPKTFVDDLKHERDRLETVYQNKRTSMTFRERRGNRAQVKDLQGALDRLSKIRDPHLRRLATEDMAREVHAAADEYRTHASAFQKELVDRHGLDPDQAEASVLRPYAVSHMRARYDESKTPTPAMVARHAEAKAAEKAAKEKLANVSARVDRLKKQRDQIIARQQVHRGRATEPQTREGVALTREEAARQGELSRATRALKAAKAERKAAAAEWKQARRQRVASNPSAKHATGLVDEHGNRISSHAIREHMAANGVREPAFVAHTSEGESARSFFVNWFNGRKTAGSGRGIRTGEATRLGAHDASFRALQEHLIRQQGIIDAIDAFDRFANQFGLRRPDGQYFTWKQAQKAAQDVSEATGVEMVPVRAIPSKLSKKAREEVASAQDVPRSPDYLQSLTARRMKEMREPPAKGDAGKATTVLVPKDQLERFADHQTKAVNDFVRTGRAVTNLFRNTVLPFSTRWIAGNTIEGLGRLISAGSDLGPDYWRGRKIMAALKQQDEQAWREIDTQLRSALHFGSRDRLAVHVTAQDIENPYLKSAALAGHAIGQAPIFKQVIGAIKLYQDAVFKGNGNIERAFQTAGIGKLARVHARELGVQWHKALVMQEHAANDIAKGLLNTPWQNRFARELDDMLGKYNGFSPQVRRAIQAYAPFAPWFFNAVKFVTYTLPVKRPVQASLIAHAEQAFHDDIKAQQDSVPFADAINLKSGIPVHGGTLDLARYTPFGAFTGGVETPGQLILPQISSAIGILAGRSFTGQPLQQQSGGDVSQGKRVVLAFYSLAESLAPGLSKIRGFEEHGETAYDDSTVFSPKTKPGTGNGGALERQLYPFRPSPIGGLSAQEEAPAPVASEQQLTPEQQILRDVRAARGARDPAAEQERLDLLRDLRAARAR